MFKALVLALLLFQAPHALNSTGVAQGCTDNTNCTYTDMAVSSGSHTYFVEAFDGTQYSSPSNSVTVTVPSGTHNVILTWTPASNGVSYFIFRTAPPTNLGISEEN